MSNNAFGQAPGTSMTDFDSALDRYVLQHSAPESDYLHSLYRATNLFTVHGRMASGHLQGLFLKMLVHMLRPHRVLEVGTFSGYSAISMAEALSDDALLHTFEVNDEMETFARRWIEGSGVGHRIVLHIGDAATLAPTLNEVFDLVFLDGDKRTYVETYEALLPLVRPGGFVLADNTLWDGHVVDHHYAHDPQTLGVDAFNRLVAADERVECVMLPLRDGLTLIRKKPV